MADIGDSISKAIAEFKSSVGGRRTAREVTADRLGEHLRKHYDSTDGELRDAISKVRSWLLEDE